MRRLFFLVCVSFSLVGCAVDRGDHWRDCVYSLRSCA